VAMKAPCSRSGRIQPEHHHRRAKCPLQPAKRWGTYS
jgi:hypothetical protein